MARIVGGLATSHIPSIGLAIAKGLQGEPYWRPFFDGFPPARAWLERQKPDIAVVIYNDHGLNFFLDKLPTFAVGAAAEYRHADEGWGLPVSRPFAGDTDFSWHVIESLVAEEFDVTTCQEMLVDHAFTIPMSLFWPGGGKWPVRTIPIAVNTVQHPLPSPDRCFKLGQALGRAIRSYEEDVKVVVIGTGGLSHQLDGTRAGFINKEFDLMCLGALPHEPEHLTRILGARPRRARGRAGGRARQLARHARRPRRRREGNPPQLPHPHFQHRDGIAGARAALAAI